jgi:YD repeat-containing protein
MRDDALNGTHWDMYGYDAASGRLASVQDVWTGEVHRFAWNPEGTLARWEEPNSYAQAFGYDEEGRLVKIERDYGSGGVQLAYEYGYNSDGARVWKRDVLNGQEYRYVCRIGCGGVPMRVYNRAMGGGSWNTLEEYLDAPTVRWYGAGANSYSDYSLLAGHWLSGCVPPPSGMMVYEDAFGLRVGGDFVATGVTKRVAEHLELNFDLPGVYLPEEPTSVKPMGLPIIIIVLGCLTACAGAAASMWNAYDICANNPPPDGCQGAPHWICWPNCLLKHGCIDAPVSFVLCVGCVLCICVAMRLPPSVCRKLGEKIGIKPKKPRKPKPRRPMLEETNLEKWVT